MKRCSGLTTATIPYSVKSITKRAKGEDFSSSSFAFPEYHPFVHDEIEDAGEDEGNDVAIGRYEQAQKRGNSLKL